MKPIVASLSRLPKAAWICFAAITALCLVSYGALRVDRARNQLIRIEAVAQQARLQQEAQSARMAAIEQALQIPFKVIPQISQPESLLPSPPSRLAIGKVQELEAAIQQIVAQIKASAESNRLTFAQIIATTTQLTAAANAGNSATADTSVQVQAAVAQILALSNRQAELEKALQQVVAQVTASGEANQATIAQIVATTEQLTAALSSRGGSVQPSRDQPPTSVGQLPQPRADGNVPQVNEPFRPAAPLAPAFTGVACTVGERRAERDMSGLERASLRVLPYPFMRYFTIASDADSMTFDAAQSIKAILASDIRLNLSDSAFIDAFYLGSKPNRPVQAPAQSQLALLDAGAVGRHEFMRLAHAGYVDTIHGWGNAIFMAADRPKLNFSSETAGKQVREDARLQSLNMQPLTLGQSVPSDLIFWYTMPFGGQITISFLDQSGTPLWSVTPTLGPRAAATPVTIRLKNVPLSVYKDAQPRISVSFAGATDKATAMVENLALSSGLRDSALSMLPVFDRLNLRLPIFTTHTFPPAGIFGLESVAMQNRVAWGARFLGDNPESPSYWIDVLDDLGVEFFLTANRTSVLDKAWDVRDLTYPFLFHDGRHRHSFHRTYHIISVVPGASDALEGSLGAQIKAAIAAGDRVAAGSGSVLYTHWGIPLAKEQFDRVGGKWPLSQPSIDGLRELGARYYGVRNGAAVAAEERIWTAPLHRTLVYSQMRRQAETHIAFGKANNAVFVNRWNDPVTGRLVPGCDPHVKRMAGITVYVDDSSTARAYVDDVEVASFTRNPADETGRQSITFVDASTPTLVFDEVDLFQLQGKVLPKSARYFLNKAEGYRSRRSIEIVAGPGDGAIKGEVEWRPAVLDASRSDAMQFAYKKSNPNSSIGIVFEMENGDSVELHESTLVRRAKGAHFDIGRSSSGDWRLVTIDHALLDHLSAGKISAPTGKVNAVRFLIDGASGDRVFFDRVALLRQNPLDDPEGGFVVGGRIDFGDLPKVPVRVIMERKGGRISETQSDASGIYQFDVKLARSEIAMIYAIGGANQDKFFPTVGRMIQVERNMVDLDISMGKDMRGPDLQASVVKEEKGVSSMVAGIGRIYKPHTQYITSGLSTPPEFRVEHSINNLGYIDRERRPENPSGALRVLMMGVCTTFGHTEEMFHHAAIVLEGMLELRTGRDVEVINMSSALQQSGYSFGYFDKLVRDYKIDVVAVELIGPLEVALTKPEFAAMYHMSEPGHFPQMAYREAADGSLSFEPADANFFLHPLADPTKKAAREEDLKKNAYVIDGVDFLYLFHRDLAGRYSDKDKSVLSYYSKLLKKLRTDFEGAGVKPVFVVNDLFGASGVAPEAWGNKIARGNFDKRMRDYCIEAGAPCLLFTEQMLKRYPDIAQRHWRRDSHYGRVGYRWFAESIADYLVASDFAKKPMQFWPQQQSN